MNPKQSISSSNKIRNRVLKYVKTISFWIVLSIILGLLIKYANSQVEGNGIFILMTGLGTLIGAINAFLTYLGSKSKTNIYSEAMKMYNGKINMIGETELTIKDKKVILDYKLEQTEANAAEYIIANIDLTDFKHSLIEKCKKEFEIIEKNNQIYRGAVQIISFNTDFHISISTPKIYEEEEA